MKQFTSVNDVSDVTSLIKKGLAFKKDPFSSIGKNKTIGLVFFNNSLRTRLSSEKAATNLGMNVIILNVGQDGWNLEFEDGGVMNGNTQEHIKDAVKVMSGYCDLIGVRAFAEFKDRAVDYSEPVLSAFAKYSEVPVISLESAIRHPLQSLADLITITETGIVKPKIAVTWAPHPKVLPQAVTNSFLEWSVHLDAEVTLAHPKGYALSNEFTEGISITNNQEEALKGADIVYTKNWSSYEQYGKCPPVEDDWTISEDKMALTNHGKFMHCLPIRRNVVATDEVIDSSIVYEQAKNRVWAAQVVFASLLEH